MNNPDEDTRVTILKDSAGVCTITLNRPEKRNAFDAETIQELTKAFISSDQDEACRAVILRGAGDHFSSGADLNWMKRMAECTYKENLADAEQLLALMEALAGCSKPTICVVQGACIGGALGLIACCDLVAAHKDAFFRFSEVLVGLTPAVVSPYVVQAIGERASRRYFLTAEKFTALEAARLGLVDEVGDDALLEEVVAGWCAAFTSAGPEALSTTKKLLHRLRNTFSDAAISRYTTETIARLRVSPEGQEGLAAFLEKRSPRWKR